VARVVWEPRAIQDLDEIAEYIARDSRDQAVEVAKAIVAMVQRAAASPEMGSIVPEYDDREIRERSACGFRIIYRTRFEDVIEVAAIRRSTRQLPRSLE
jgi:toxin ParE1/3/4